MKKRLLSILLMCCMVLTLLPTTAFAEDSAEEPPVCSCETACTVDNMNKECPACGAENAIPQNCGQYIPVEDRTGENSSTEGADDPNGPTELSAADQVQAMIDGLPNAEEITEDNTEEVKAQLEAIDEAKEKLSDEEIDELDMTRYAEAAAALGALAAPMLLANDSPDEQFSLAPGGTYYFDLSGENIPGTANGSLPDASLHYVPFTYAGTVNAYKLTSAMATTEEYAEQNKYDHSLFIADFAVTNDVSWDALNGAGLIFGKDYAAQACKNARALGQALYERGVPVLCENLGFTRSHAIALDVTEFGKGKACAKLLEDANIICNKNMLPSDTSSVNPSGLRLGTQEMTRLGMKENEMDEVADFIARVVVKKEDPAKVKKEVTEFKHGFDTIQYCFNAGEPAYEYRKLVP